MNQQKANEGKVKQELFKHCRKSCISKSHVSNIEQWVQANCVHGRKLLQLGTYIVSASYAGYSMKQNLLIFCRKNNLILRDNVSPSCFRQCLLKIYYCTWHVNKIKSLHTGDVMKYIVNVSDVVGGQFQVCHWLHKHSSSKSNYLLWFIYFQHISVLCSTLVRQNFSYRFFANESDFWFTLHTCWFL